MNTTRDTGKGAEPRGAEPVRPSSRDPIESWLDVFVRMLGVTGEAASRIRDELEDHLRTRVDDLLITGISEPEAVRRAVAELGESADLAGRFKAAMTPRRRTWMHASLIGMAGAALAAGVMAVVPPSGGPGASGLGAGVGVADAATDVGAELGAELGAGLGSAEHGSSGSSLASSSVEMSEGVASPHDENLRRYDLTMLVANSSATGGATSARNVMVTVQQLVQPDIWGGPNRSGSIHVSGSSLFVNATADVHESVAWVLASLAEDAERAIVRERREAVVRHDARERLIDEMELMLEKTTSALDSLAMHDTVLRAHRDALFQRASEVIDAYGRVRPHLNDLEEARLSGRFNEEDAGRYELLKTEARELFDRRNELNAEIESVSTEQQSLSRLVDDALNERSEIRARLLDLRMSRFDESLKEIARGRTPDMPDAYQRIADEQARARQVQVQRIRQYEEIREAEAARERAVARSRELRDRRREQIDRELTVEDQQAANRAQTIAAQRDLIAELQRETDTLIEQLGELENNGALIPQPELIEAYRMEVSRLRELLVEREGRGADDAVIDRLVDRAAQSDELARANQISVLTGLRSVTLLVLSRADDEGSFTIPELPSALREAATEHGYGVELFLTPIDREAAARTGSIPEDENERWAWIDRNASVEFVPGEATFDSWRPVVTLKRMMHDDLTAIGFADGRVQVFGRKEAHELLTAARDD